MKMTYRESVVMVDRQEKRRAWKVVLMWMDLTCKINNVPFTSIIVDGAIRKARKVKD